MCHLSERTALTTAFVTPVIGHLLEGEISQWVHHEEGRMHSTHFIYGYMVSDIWLRTILIVRKETCCCHIGYSLQLIARVLLYAPSHRLDSTYHSLYYTSRGALAGMRNSSMGSPHEGSIQRPIHRATSHSPNHERLIK